jgi:GNAT superfamily N-acetyltransferase
VSRPPVEVRKAGVDDLDDLLLLWSQSREELNRNLRVLGAVPADQLRPRLKETLACGDPLILVARHEGQPAGYALLRIAPVLAVDPAALHIDHLYVAPAVRRRGVARALLVAVTSIAERNGAEQVLAGAPPSARDTHRFLARLGFSPLVVRRVTGTSALRRRLAGEGQRRGLEDLLSRRRSLRARAARAAGWTGGWSDGVHDDVDEVVDDAVVDDVHADVGTADVGTADVRVNDGLPRSCADHVVIADSRVQRIDLGRLDADPWPGLASDPAMGPQPTLDADSPDGAGTGAPPERAGRRRQRA